MKRLIFAATLAGLPFIASAQANAPHAPGWFPLDLYPFFIAVDTNHDGCLSEDEWKKAGAPISSFNMLNEKGCVTYLRMYNEKAPDDIDSNKDGKLTLEKLIAFDKKGPPPMPGAGAPPPK
jgi:hypothetical protein